MKLNFNKIANRVALSFFTCAIAVSLTGCEEDVVLNLGEIEMKLVVEARISNENPNGRVMLSYSQNFYDQPNNKLLRNATVKLTSSVGQSETLLLNPNGYYETRTIKPEQGLFYTLDVSVDGIDVQTSTYLPKKVEIFNVSFVPNPFYKNPDSLNVFVSVADPKGEDNFFRLRVNKAGIEKTNEYYLSDDSFGKDGIISMPIYFKTYSPGDTIVVELYHITPELFQYFSTLSENIRGSFNSIAPGNPVSNMPDDVYGFFGGYFVDTDTIVVENRINSY